MKIAYIFPGQGAQYAGMGKEMYDGSPQARKMFDRADEILGFRITEVMFSGTEEDLKQTKATQPAVFLHSVIMATMLGDRFRPDMVAGHSLGEFSALVAAKALSFEDGLKLVSRRARAMQKACEAEPSAMAAVLGLDEAKVEEICKTVTGVAVPANYNCPEQLVISGSVAAVEEACEKLKAAGAKRAIRLQVGGAFHSPLMESARVALEEAINETEFSYPVCPIYQNVTAGAVTDPALIQANLVAQLTAPVRWTQSVINMVADGATDFIEIGPGKVLQGLVKKTHPNVNAGSAEISY
ncbi:MAG: ACP S-malonyltransferase [Bacteroidales bacterium]|jgi:[acyl-carrier-protein] S-malonyltransferase|nr:ACP S-malonyltransferase [Bacteroidales bacterium]